MRAAHNIWDLRAQAKRRLPKAIWEFIERGTEDDILIAHNNAMLRAIKFNPRTLRDVTTRDLSIELFGKKRATPLIIAPTGIADLACFRGESCIASAAAAAGVPFSLATSSTTSVDTIADITRGGAGFWQQMYLWERRDHSWLVVDRAAKLGAEALILTVDTPIWPNREFNKRNGMANPIRANPRLAWSFMQRPGWMAGVLGRYMLNGGIPTFANYPDAARSGGKGVARVTNSASVNWDDVSELKRRFPGKLLLKGILNRDDALAAAEQGVDGIIVSNHGGRTFDASPASIEVLADIVDAVGDRTTVIFDSGIRRGSDVLKAMAIGAHAVMIGRATLYGAAAGNRAGAALAIDILKQETSTAMAMVGVTSLRELDRSFLRRETVPGL